MHRKTIVDAVSLILDYILWKRIPLPSIFSFFNFKREQVISSKILPLKDYFLDHEQLHQIAQYVALESLIAKLEPTGHLQIKSMFYFCKKMLGILIKQSCLQAKDVNSLIHYLSQCNIECHTPQQAYETLKQIQIISSLKRLLDRQLPFPQIFYSVKTQTSANRLAIHPHPKLIQALKELDSYVEPYLEDHGIDQERLLRDILEMTFDRKNQAQIKAQFFKDPELHKECIRAQSILGIEELAVLAQITAQFPDPCKSDCCQLRHQIYELLQFIYLQQAIKEKIAWPSIIQFLGIKPNTRQLYVKYQYDMLKACAQDQLFQRLTFELGSCQFLYNHRAKSSQLQQYLLRLKTNYQVQQQGAIDEMLALVLSNRASLKSELEQQIELAKRSGLIKELLSCKLKSSDEPHKGFSILLEIYESFQTDSNRSLKREPSPSRQPVVCVPKKQKTVKTENEPVRMNASNFVRLAALKNIIIPQLGRFLKFRKREYYTVGLKRNVQVIQILESDYRLQSLMEQLIKGDNLFEFESMIELIDNAAITEEQAILLQIRLLMQHWQTYKVDIICLCESSEFKTLMQRGKQVQLKDPQSPAAICTTEFQSLVRAVKLKHI